MTNVQVEKLTS